MANGIIVIDKPQDWTSMDVCARLRRVFGEKRIGHAGTLDPMATGVLPVFVGRATRAVEFAAEGGKEYVAGLKLGIATDTQDMTGRILEEHPVTVTQAQVEAVLEQFRGDILQIPPMYSAVKVNGKKLYQLARKGKEVERQPRPITIHKLALSPADQEGTDYCLTVVCSKGSYIRTLCHDIGQALGCGGTLSSLRRTEAAGFTLAQSIPLADLLAQAETADVSHLLLSVDQYFSAYPQLTVDEAAERKIRNGNSITWTAEPGTYRVYAPGGDFLMLAKQEGNSLNLIKSFYEV